jgi:predicted secreted protein
VRIISSDGPEVLGAVHASVLISSFVIFWFLALFCLLPVGLGEIDPETGAPKNPMLLRKAAIATAVAVVLWIAFYAVIALGWLDL